MGLVGRRRHEGGGPVQLVVERVEAPAAAVPAGRGRRAPAGGAQMAGVDRPPGQRGRGRPGLRSMRCARVGGSRWRHRCGLVGGGGRPGQPGQVALPEDGLVRCRQVRVERGLRVPALEEPEGVRRLEVFGPDVLHAAGVAPVASVTSARLASTSSRSAGSKLSEPAMMIMPGGYCLRRSLDGGQLVLDQRPALHHGQQAGRVLQHGDVGERIAVHHEQVGQVALAHRAELVARAP